MSCNTSSPFWNKISVRQVAEHGQEMRLSVLFTFVFLEVLNYPSDSDLFFYLPGKPMNPHLLFHNAASNIICQVLFAKHFDYEDDFLKFSVHLFHETSKIINGRWSLVSPATDSDVTSVVQIQKSNVPVDQVLGFKYESGAGVQGEK